MGDLSLSFPPLSDFPRASVSNIKGFVNWLSTKIEVCPSATFVNSNRVSYCERARAKIRECRGGQKSTAASIVRDIFSPLRIKIYIGKFDRTPLLPKLIGEREETTIKTRSGTPKSTAIKHCPQSRIATLAGQDSSAGDSREKIFLHQQHFDFDCRNKRKNSVKTLLHCHPGKKSICHPTQNQKKAS